MNDKEMHEWHRAKTRVHEHTLISRSRTDNFRANHMQEIP